MIVVNVLVITAAVFLFVSNSGIGGITVQSQLQQIPNFQAWSAVKPCEAGSSRTYTHITDSPQITSVKAFTTPLTSNPCLGPYEAAVTNPETGLIEQKTYLQIGKIDDSSAMEVFSDAMAYMYNKVPASTVYTAEETVAYLNPVNEVNAQGVPTFNLSSGNEVLLAIGGVHQQVQRLVFFIYIIIFMVIVFAIMMRKKIGGQTYVSVVNSIPRIIISLLLVTFSYQICALVIDAGNIGYQIIYSLSTNSIQYRGCDNQTLVNCDADSVQRLGSSANFTGKDELLKAMMPGDSRMSVFQIFGTSGANDTATLQSGVNIDPSADFGNGILSMLVGAIITAANKTQTEGSNQIADFASGGANTLLAWVLSVAAVFAAFKLFFALFKDYLTIMLYPIIAPITFATYAMPGQDKAIETFIRNMAGSVFSMVAVYGMFVLMFLFGRGFFVDPDGGDKLNLYKPPLLALTSTTNISWLYAFAAYGIFIITPKVPEEVKKMIGASTSNKWGTEISNATRTGINKASLGAI